MYFLKAFLSILSLLSIFIMVPLKGLTFGAVLLTGLSGNETPFDNQNANSPEYGGPSEVLAGIINVDDSDTYATAFLAAYGGGIVGLHYGPTPGKNGVWERKTAFPSTQGQTPVYAIGISGVNATGTTYVDTFFVTASDGNATPSYFLLIYSSHGTALDLLAYKELNSYPYSIESSQVSQSGRPPVAFLIVEDECFGLNASLSGNDTVPTADVPIVMAYAGNATVTSSTRDYLVVGETSGRIQVFHVDPSKIGDSNTSNAVHDTGLYAFVDSAPTAIATYSSPSVDGNDTSQEVLVFVATQTGLHAFEIDANSTNSTKEVLEDKGQVFVWGTGELSVRDIYLEPGGDQSLRQSYVLMACGEKGLFVLRTGGNANTGQSLTDSITTTFLVSIGTTGETLKVLGTGGTVDTTQIQRIYVADGGAGLKVFGAQGLDSIEDANISLTYQWDPGVSPVQVGTLKVDGNGYALVLDREGGLRSYDLSTPGPPQLILSSEDNSTGLDPVTSSSVPRGRPYAFFMDQDSSNASTANVFLARGSGGVDFLKVKGLGTSSFRYEGPLAHVDTGGEALGISGFRTGSGTYVTAVALGTGGVMFQEIDATTGASSNAGSVILQGTAYDTCLVHDQTGEDYAYVAYGSLGLAVFRITGRISNPEFVNLVGPETLGVDIVKKVKVRFQDNRYKAYILGGEGHMVVCDCTNPSSISVDGIFPGDTGRGLIEAFAFVDDVSTEKHYVIAASSETNSLSDPRRLVFVINVTDPSHMAQGSVVPVDPPSGRYVPMTVDALEVGGKWIGVLGAVLDGSGPMGLLGTFGMELIGSQPLLVQVAGDSCPVSPGEVVSLSTTVSGGISPYFYSWDKEEITGDESTGWSWTAPSIPGQYSIGLKVTDSDGNTGTYAFKCNVELTGLSLPERLSVKNSVVTLPLTASGVTVPIDAWGVEVSYDANTLEFVNAENTDDTLGWTVSTELKEPGRIRLGGMSNGHAPIAPGVTAELARLTFEVKEVSGYGDGSCLSQEILSPVSLSPLSPSQLMGDLEGVELHSGQVKIVLPGDLDGDLCVTPQDALDCFLGFLGFDELREDQRHIADVDHDGVISPQDAVMILDMYLR